MGGTDGRTDVRTYGNSPLCPTRHRQKETKGGTGRIHTYSYMANSISSVLMIYVAIPFSSLLSFMSFSPSRYHSCRYPLLIPPYNSCRSPRLIPCYYSCRSPLLIPRRIFLLLFKSFGKADI